MGFPGERNSHKQHLKKFVAWEAWLGTLHHLMVRKSSVAAQDQAHGADPLGPSSGPRERRLAAASKPPDTCKAILPDVPPSLLICSLSLIMVKKKKYFSKYFFFSFFFPSEAAVRWIREINVTWALHSDGHFLGSLNQAGILENL